MENTHKYINNSKIPKNFKKNLKIYNLAIKYGKNSNYVANFKIGDMIEVEWTIKKDIIIWGATVVKITNIARYFGRPVRIYVVKYKPNKYYPTGKIMYHCFIDERRLFDITDNQLASYFKI